MFKINSRHRLILKWFTGLVFVFLPICYVFVMMDGGRLVSTDTAGQSITQVLTREADGTDSILRFEDVTVSAGVDLPGFSFPRRSAIEEDMGSGCAWGDFDNDGDPDLIVVTHVPKSASAPSAGRNPAPPPSLFRNEGAGRFIHVSHALNIPVVSEATGAAWGDYDGDGDLDLYITCVGQNCLLRNDGSSGFVEVGEIAGVDDRRFSASAAWADYDRDGDLDLYVANYVRKDSLAGMDMDSQLQGYEIPVSLNPSAYDPVPNSLYRNEGNGTFQDVAAEAGVADSSGRSLGVVWIDHDDDGLPDLYVANDVSHNGVFRNQGDGTFEDIGSSSFAADYRGAMGLAVGDVDRDGDPDLFVTHWVGQENALFVNMSRRKEGSVDGRRMFYTDRAEALGLGQISLDMVGWATGLADFDNDGLLDLWVVNGHTLEQAASATSGIGRDSAADGSSDVSLGSARPREAVEGITGLSSSRELIPQRPHLFRQVPGEGFIEVGPASHPSFLEPRVGRGGAQSDFDGDGRMDLALVDHDGRVRLLRNVTDTGRRRWVTIHLRQPGLNTRALGARVQIRDGERRWVSWTGTGTTYLSQHEEVFHAGVGEAEFVQVQVRWPDGFEETIESVPTMVSVRINRGRDPLTRSSLSMGLSRSVPQPP